MGNCSAPNFYNYELDELRPIFLAIIEKLVEVWRRMNCHSPYSFVPFRLNKHEELIVGDRHCRWDKMATKAEVLNMLAENGARYTSLEPIRSQYNESVQLEGVDYGLLAFEWSQANVQRLYAQNNEAIANGQTQFHISAEELPHGDSWPSICTELIRNGFADAQPVADGIRITIKAQGEEQEEK